MQQQETVILIDVRTPEERAISMIPGAISQTEFEQNISKYQQNIFIVADRVEQSLHFGRNIFDSKNPGQNRPAADDQQQFS